MLPLCQNKIANKIVDKAENGFKTIIESAIVSLIYVPLGII